MIIEGWGYTTENEIPFTIKLLSEDVIGLIDALGIEQTNILGYSLGSVVTTKLLLDNLKRFKKAIIYTTSIDGSSVVKNLKDKLKNSSSKGKKIKNKDTILKQVAAAEFWRVPMNKVPLIKNDVMYIVGVDDSVVGTESSKKLVSVVPGACLVQFENATGRLMWEAPIRYY